MQEVKPKSETSAALPMLNKGKGNICSIQDVSNFCAEY